MNELVKTLSFVAVAVVVALAAWLIRPSYENFTQSEKPGGTLYAEFDPLLAASLEVVEFDPDTATVKPFKVAQVDNQWSIPSHDNYPADAQDRLAQAATGLMGLKILDVASDSPGDHALYGVVEPDLKKLKSGDTGVGMKVMLKDKADKPLVALVIGKKAPAGKEDSAEQELRYVRRAGQDPVYVVAMKTDKLTTKFEDWIEKDLLKLNAYDIKRIAINDYSIDILNGTQTPRGQMAVEYNDAGEPRWQLIEDTVFKNDDFVPQTLAADEELNTTKLDDLRNALDDLKIVDVRPKPAGLSADLKLGESLPKDEEGMESLQSRGFYPAKINNQYELLSNDGEFRVLMKDGVRYVLRFGQIVAGGTETKQEETKPGEEAKPAAGMNRYLMVAAEFDANSLEQPKLDPLPEAAPAEEKKEDAAKADEAKADEAKADEAKADESKADESKADESKADESKADESKTDESKTDESKTDEAKTDEAKTDEAKTDEAKTDEAKTDEAKTDEAKTDEAAAKTDEAENKDAAEKQDGDAEKKDDAAEKKDEAADKAAAELKAKQEQVEKDNKRKQDEYQEKVKKGEEHAKELNARFAGWYYVISDDVYRKIHLSRADLIKKKEEKKDDAASTPGGAATTGTGTSAAMPPADSADEKPAEPSFTPDDFDRLKQESLKEE